MRFFCIGSIVCVLCMSANPVEAITYNSVSNESSHIHQIPQNELYEAKVLLTYIETYRDKIRNIAQSLDVENTPFMHDIFTTLSKMQEALIYI